MQIKKRLLPSEFTKNTMVLIAGTVVAQAIPLLLHPFLRRIYSAEDFGAMAVFLSLFSMITIVAAFRYESTIVLPKNDNEAANILGLTFLINLCFNSIILLVLVFFKAEIVTLIGFPLKYANYLYFLPFTSFLFCAYQSMNYWLIRQKAFKASSFNKIVRRTAEGIVQVILGVLKFPGGLFVGDFIGNFSNVISGIRQVFKNKFNNAFVSKRKMGFVAKKYIDYPKFNLLPTLLSSAATLLPFLFINKLYSTEIVGYLDLSRMVLSIPLIFISTTISQVLFQKITENKHQQTSILIELRNIFFLLLSIIFIEVILLYFFGDFLFGLIFG
ncbi:MAG TPA: oligosaccharide flippase family protein, partial [Vicingaceae bacterium]